MGHGGTGHKLKQSAYLIRSVFVRNASKRLYHSMGMYCVFMETLVKPSCFDCFFDSSRSSNAWSIMLMILAFSASRKGFGLAGPNSTSDELKSSIATDCLKAGKDRTIGQAVMDEDGTRKMKECPEKKKEKVEGGRRQRCNGKVQDRKAWTSPL